MECSTTELRQRARGSTGISQKGPDKAADPCHKAQAGASAAGCLGQLRKPAKLAPSGRQLLEGARLWADPVPNSLTSGQSRILSANSRAAPAHGFARRSVLPVICSQKPSYSS